jgi:hypothetical protein
VGPTVLPPELLPSGLASGRHDVLIRPEFVSVHTAPGPDRIEVRLVERHFLGEALRLTLALEPSGSTLLARVSGTEMTALLDHDESRRYFVSWDPAQAVVLESASTQEETAA